MFENEGTLERDCIEMEDWGLSVLAFQENSIYTLHLRFS